MKLILYFFIMFKVPQPFSINVFSHFPHQGLGFNSWMFNLTTLSLIINKDSNIGMKNLIQCKGEIVAIRIHRSPTLGTKSSSSKNSIFNWLEKDKRKIISMLMFGNCGLASYSISYFQLNLNPCAHASVNNKWCQIPYSC